MPLCSLGNTKPGQKVTGLSSECAVRRHSAAQDRTVNHHFYLGAVRRLRNADRRNGGLFLWQVTIAPVHCPNLCSRFWPHTTPHRRVNHTTPPQFSMRVFPLSFLKHTLRGKAFEVENRSKVTSHSNLYRCTDRTAVGASSSGRASAISLSKQKCSGSEGIST